MIGGQQPLRALAQFGRVEQEHLHSTQQNRGIFRKWFRVTRGCRYRHRYRAKKSFPEMSQIAQPHPQQSLTLKDECVMDCEHSLAAVAGRHSAPNFNRW